MRRKEPIRSLTQFCKITKKETFAFCPYYEVVYRGRLDNWRLGNEKILGKSLS